MSLGKDKLIPILAMLVLLVGTISTIYVHGSEIDKDTINIDGNEVTVKEIYSICKTKTIQTDDGERTGASLEDLHNNFIISCKSCNTFTIKAKDSYQQTVDLETFKSGVLTEEKRVFFPDTAHALWVRDVIEIEVK